MRNLITADVIRILKKPSYRAALAATFIISIIWALQAWFGAFNGYSFVKGQSSSMGMVRLILGIATYISVYADEFTSNSMQCLIGHGISRFKLLVAKFIDCVIITGISFIAFGTFSTLLGIVLGSGMNSLELSFLWSGMLISALKIISYSTISMIILYWTKNVAFATALNVILNFSADHIGGIFRMLPGIKFLHLENKFFPGAFDLAQSRLLLGNVGELFNILWILVNVCVPALLISYLLFRKKELDF